ncbi:extracellular solute-binding protein [Microbacterium sp. MEC084]|uniref:extracellular solute-binding protein n=1 Tax=Microbacterium sp. MEC084 TaxID=1963027 RepID=UPI0010700BC6|nr:extracellular solute-binding protein [Microbacterium sp. MEC084]MCD1269029.1 extracellular solute-binding protein [Microbacterium sp. MEC084]
MDVSTPRRIGRRRTAALAGLITTALALTACGTAGPAPAEGAGGDGAAVASIWALSGQPVEGIRQDSVDAFNEAHPDQALELTFFQNDAYKTKIRTAIGARQAPTLIYGWGGGTLKSYVDAGQVEDLTDWLAENPDVKDRLFPGAFGAATVDGRIYAMPYEDVTPIVLFYNKRVFEEAGVEPPETWDDLMALVEVFNAEGIAPFSLGGQSRWTSMMWLEYLFDRVGGPEVFDAIFAGEPDAWSDPAALQALEMAQDLVRADGFVKGFGSIAADSNADQALLYTGKAAMMLHGGWTYGGMKADGGDFVPSGDLGWVPFPVVEGGKGDPANAVGNPAAYLSVSSAASDEAKEAALTYLAEGLSTEAEVDALIGSGAVPVVNGIEDKLASTPDAEYTTFVYDLASNAPNFQQSWDQALSPAAAEELLNNIEQLFALSITPEEFAANMNETIGE